MKLTHKNKKYIDSLSYYELLNLWRFAPSDNPWFGGETGIYWSNRMEELRNEPGGSELHTRVSKLIGWRNL